MLHQAKTICKMLDKASEAVSPGSSVSVNIHAKSKEEFNNICDCMIEAGYSCKENRTGSSKWIDFHMPQGIDLYSRVCIFHP